MSLRNVMLVLVAVGSLLMLLPLSVQAGSGDVNVQFVNGTTYSVSESVSGLSEVQVWQHNSTTVWSKVGGQILTGCPTTTSVTLPDPSKDNVIQVWDCFHTRGYDNSFQISGGTTVPVSCTKCLTVGGTLGPIDKLALVLPTVGIALVAVVAAALGVFVLRRRSSES